MLLSCTTIFAQYEKGKVAAGFKAGANLSTFRTPVSYTDFDPTWTKLGFAGGLFVEIPLLKAVSLQPEFLYSALGSDVYTAQGNERHRFNYFSVPLLAKVRFAKSWHLLGGVQGDVLFRGRRLFKEGGYATTVTDQTRDFDFAYTGGLEAAITRRISFMARYIHGVHDVSLDPAAHTAYNQAVQGTFNVKLGRLTKPAPKVVVVPPPVDTDNDGIIDELDKCPTVPGLAKYDGCPIPDTDKDGINDEEDKCPTVPGVAKYQGCPIPDTDKDGINDEEDKCPTVPGLARYQGCPIPDSDNDGVNDEEDRCPYLAGTVANHGCPEIQEEVRKKVSVAADRILFATGSAKLAASSNKGLNEVAKILQDNPDMKLAIDGHTDNTGTAEKNQVLSENRAAAVKAYFISKGIDESRITSAGHGQDSPIADNKTAAGRQKNRRVELTLNYY